jgi:hypothetical protein
MQLNKTSKDSQIHVDKKLSTAKNIKLIHNCLDMQRKNETMGKHKNNDIGPRFSHSARCWR